MLTTYSNRPSHSAGACPGCVIKAYMGRCMGSSL
jgi:hypothetical protein